MNVTGRFLDSTEMPDANALIDRIINVKFIRNVVDADGNIVVGGKTEEFIIRSDYEVIYTNGGLGYYFRKCYVKPSIKIKYKQVTENTAIELMLEVHNLHAFSYTEDSSKEFSYANFPIKSVEIHFGYFGQFPKFNDAALGLSLDDYYNMNGEVDTSVIKANVIAVYPVKTPPDSITQFNCIVSTPESGFVFQGNEENTETVFNKSDKSIMGAIFKEYITKRFVRYYDEGLTTKKGLLTDAEADKYGVKVFMSDYVKNGHPDFPQRYAPKSAEDSDKEKVFTIRQSNRVTRALENIRDAGFDTLRFFPLIDGNYMAYDKDEAANPEKISGSTDINKVMLETPIIPAIYSMTFGATRTIKCPFFKILNPLQQVKFQSRYNLANLVGYFYRPEPGQDEFFVVSCLVEFATVEDVNMMTLTNVDKGEEK